MDIYTFHSPKSLVGRRTSSFTRTRRWFSGRSCALKCRLDHHINGKNREYKAMSMKGATTAQPTNACKIASRTFLEACPEIACQSASLESSKGWLPNIHSPRRRNGSIKLHQSTHAIYYLVLRKVLRKTNHQDDRSRQQ
jgi:hypothetical protein